MNPVSDLKIKRYSEITELQEENHRFRGTIVWLQGGVIFLGIVAVMMIWVIFYSAKKAGYEEAAMDFYHGKLKVDIVDEKVIWK